MKRIMFNDTFALTKAVLKEKKTMTRRILPLTEADKEYLETAFDWDLRESVILDRYAKYNVGDVVAIAQSYKDCGYSPEDLLENVDGGYTYAGDMAGYNNKMFVQAKHMVNFIEITHRKIERLRNISYEDCLREGIYFYNAGIIGCGFVFDGVPEYKKTYYDSPIRAFATLINKINGISTWRENPWVVAYTYYLIKRRYE